MTAMITRIEALNFRSLRYVAQDLRPFEVLVAPDRDPGCYTKGHELLGPFAREMQHALVVFDYQFEGARAKEPADLASDVEERCRPVWGDRCKCIVIEPELEVWVWSDSPHVRRP